MDGFRKTFTVLPVYTPGKHWVAVAEREDKVVSKHNLAASVLVKERSLFMIKVMYYVQVKVTMGSLQKNISLKIPFLLAPNSSHIQPAC